MNNQNQQINCPKCGKLVYPNAVTKQGSARMFENIVNIIDVGYGCPECGHEWGYEIFNGGK